MRTLWIFAGRVLFWLTWPLLFVYLYRGGVRSRVVIEAEGKILLVKGWLGDGRWLLPGGGVRRGENPLVGAVREVSEETGLKLSTRQLRKFHEGEASQNGLSFKYIAYVAKINKVTPLIRQPYELVDAEWLAMQNILLRTDISPDTKRILQSYGTSR